MRRIPFVKRFIPLAAALVVCLSWQTLWKLNNFLLFDDFDVEDVLLSSFKEETNSKHVHHYMPYSDEILKQQELKHWGKYTYGPNRVLCAVPTTWSHSAHKIERLQNTFGPLCDVLIFCVSQNDTIPSNIDVGEVLVVNMTRSSDPQERNIWNKVHAMWSVIVEKYIDQAEWFLKVDDDTYLFVDHLKGFTQYYNPSIPRYFGHTILYRWKDDNVVFNSGAAYVLSRAALQRVAVKLKTIPRWQPDDPLDLCMDQPGSGDDTSIAVCLRDVGILPDNTLDEYGRQRFLTFHLDAHYEHKREDDDSWFWRYKPKNMGTEQNCCVPEAELISAHQYKRKEDDNKFYALHEMALASRNHTPSVPPKPSLFLYEQDLLDFEIDEWRNSLSADKEKSRFTGW